MRTHNFEEKVNLRGTDIKKWNFYPEDVIPMWIADTDFKCPEPIVTALVERAKLGLYGYPLLTNRFNKAVQTWMQKRFNWEIKEEWVEFAPAVVAGIVNAIQAYTNIGDKVVIMSPVYHPFQSIIGNCGREKSASTLIAKEDGSWEIDFKDLEKKLSDVKARALILCNPHNPLGKVFTKEELLKIGELCLKYNVVAISDEIHSDLVYSNKKHIPFPSLSEELAKISLSFVNPSKTFNIPGVRTAAAIIPDENMRNLFHTNLVANRANGVTTFGLLPFEVAYEECDYYADQFVEYIENNYKYLVKYVNENIPKIKVGKSDATYLIWINCKELNMSQKDLMDFMLQKAKIAFNDGSTFGSEGVGYVRMNIACHHSTLEKALKQLENAIKTLK